MESLEGRDLLMTGHWQMMKVNESRFQDGHQNVTFCRYQDENEGEQKPGGWDSMLYSYEKLPRVFYLSGP